MKIQRLTALLAGLLFAISLKAQITKVELPSFRPPKIEDLQLHSPELPPGYAAELLSQGFKTVWAQLPQIGQSVPIKVKEYGNNYLFEGDIILRPHQITSNSDARPTRITEYRTREQGLYGETNTYANGEYLWLWQYGKIPYKIADDVPSGLRRRILEAIAELRRQSDGYITMVPRSSQEDYVVFYCKPELGSGGRSCLGRVGGPQEIELGRSIPRGSIMHEILHAAGVFHEHTRPDRDYYVNIEWSNIEYGSYGNFTFFNTAILGKTYTPYDYYSIMHYRGDAMGKKENGRRLSTIIPLRTLTSRMGQRDSLSTMDKKGLKRMYGRQKWYISEDGRGQWVALNSSAIKAKDLAGADFNGDGLTDLFRTANGKWYVSYGGVSSWEVINTSDIQREQLLFGDFNGDGKADVMYPNGREFKVCWSGKGTWKRLNRSAIRKDRLQIGDFNGDGRADIFYANGSRWKVSWSGTSSWRTINSSAATKSKLIIGDFNGDGTSDVLVTTGSQWKVSWGGHRRWVTLNSSSITKEDLMWSDFNGDGNTDLFFANGQEWKVSWSARTQWSTMNRSRIRKEDLKTGNFDGDNISDIFGSWDD